MFCDEAGDDPGAEWGGAEGRARPALEALTGPRARGRLGPADRAGGRLRARRSGRGCAALSHVTPVTLGPRILRADTAAISALTLWQAALGDWVDTAEPGELDSRSVSLELMARNA